MSLLKSWVITRHFPGEFAECRPVAFPRPKEKAEKKIRNIAKQNNLKPDMSKHYLKSDVQLAIR